MPQEPMHPLSCPNPRCGEPVTLDQDDAWCHECGEYFSADFAARLPRLIERQAAMGRLASRPARPVLGTMFSMFEEHQESDLQLDRQPPDARWLVLFVFLAILFGLVAFPTSFWKVAWFIGAPFLWYIGRRAAQDLRDSRRHDSLPQEWIVDDQRPPVLYLRSFVTDGSMPERPASDEFYMFLNALRSPLTTILALQPEQSYEELLSAPLSKIGPVIALARPYENLPELGATRLRVEGEWQSKVESILRSCSLVVFNGRDSSCSQGLWWELQRAVELVPLSKIIIFLPLEPLDIKNPEVREVRYQGLSKRIEAILGRSLPSVIGRNQCIYFDAVRPRTAKNVDNVLASIGLLRKGRPTQPLERTAGAAAQR
jgi:hypothetical protein